MKNALIVGGTGMLAGATRALASEVETMTLVARNPQRLGELSCAVRPIAVDYRDVDALRRELVGAQSQDGEFDVALTWIHGSGDAASRMVGELLAEQDTTCRLFDVRGSASGPPLPESDPRHDFLLGLDSVAYRVVVLGKMTTTDGWRWLTNREISEGVLRAIRSDEGYTVVGTV